MGAPARIWVGRILGTLAALAGMALALVLPVPLWAGISAIVVGLGIGGAVAYRKVAAFDPLGRVRWRLAPHGRRVCALTFDDGPGPATGEVLDILATAGAKATFFVLANNALRHPDVLRRAAAEGHAIGVHGRTHGKLAGADERRVEDEVTGCIDGLRVLGIPHARVYRTPHGHKSSAVFAVAKRRNLTLWAWSRGVWDTDGPPPDVLVRRATRWARPGMVLLLHDGRGEEIDPDVRPMLAALPRILETLKARGFEFVALDPA